MFSASHGHFEETNSTNCQRLYSIHTFTYVGTYISFSHLMVGDGSPTALQGSTMSLIQGVVTVLLKVRIRAGAAKIHKCFISSQSTDRILEQPGKIHIHVFLC